MKTQQTKTYGYRMKVVLRGKFTAVHAYTKKSESSDRSNFKIHLGVLEKVKQDKSKLSRWKEITKIRSEIREI